MPTCQTTDYFQGRGNLYVARKNASTGVLLEDYRALGNTPSFVISSTQDRLDIRESCSGNNAIAASAVQSTDFNISIDAHNFNSSILKDILWGAATAEAASSNTETLTFYEEGGVQRLTYPNVSTVTAVTEVGSPSYTLVEDTDYSIDKPSGLVTLLSFANLLGSPNHQISVQYTYGSHDRVDAFTHSQYEYGLVFQGINVFTGLGVRITVHRVQLDLPESMNFITDEEYVQSMGGRVLQDTTQSSGSEYFVIETND